MKKGVVLIMLVCATILVPAQSLLDIYQKGTVKLVPDHSYGQGNDWAKVFETYYETMHDRAIGQRKNIVMKPDGSAIVSHAYKNYYSLFDRNGKFVKEVKLTDKSGKVLNTKEPIKGVIGNNLFTGVDNMGYMYGVDFDGKFVKQLRLNYLVFDMIPLDDHFFAVSASVVWKNNRMKDFIAIVNYNTNEQVTVWEEVREDNTESRFAVTTPEGGNMHLFINLAEQFQKYAKLPFISPYNTICPVISSVNGQLVVAFPQTGEIHRYNTDGKLVVKDKVSWAQKSISVEEQKRSLREKIEEFRKLKIGSEAQIPEKDFEMIRTNTLALFEKRLSMIDKPFYYPAFSTVIKDSDGNLLFFEMIEESNKNRFNVWIFKDGGKFVCQSSFVCDEYDLSITPSKMVFHNGYIYSLQTLKNATGNPLRLVRFKLTN